MSLTQLKSDSMVSLRNICKTFSPDSVSEVVLFSDFNLEILPRAVCFGGRQQRLRQNHHAQPHLRQYRARQRQHSAQG